MISLGIFLMAYIVLVVKCVAMYTVPNFPSPFVLPSLKSLMLALVSTVWPNVGNIYFGISSDEEYFLRSSTFELSSLALLLTLLILLFDNSSTSSCWLERELRSSYFFFTNRLSTSPS